MIPSCNKGYIIFLTSNSEITLRASYTFFISFEVMEFRAANVKTCSILNIIFNPKLFLITFYQPHLLHKTRPLSVGTAYTFPFFKLFLIVTKSCILSDSLTYNNRIRIFWCMITDTVSYHITKPEPDLVSSFQTDILTTYYSTPDHNNTSSTDPRASSRIHFKKIFQLIKRGMNLKMIIDSDLLMYNSKSRALSNPVYDWCSTFLLHSYEHSSYFNHKYPTN